MPKLRLTPRPGSNVPPHLERDLQRAIAIVREVRHALTQQITRLEQLDSELRLLVAGPAPLREPLSPRQVEALRALALGESNAEIAARLGVSPRTVTQIITRIYRKLDVRNRNEAALTAWRLGLI